MQFTTNLYPLSFFLSDPDAVTDVRQEPQQHLHRPPHHDPRGGRLPAHPGDERDGGGRGAGARNVLHGARKVETVPNGHARGTGASGKR